MRDGLSASRWPGPLGRFLDADHDVLLDNAFITFELETLMGMGPKVVIPVLTYLFHRIEQRLDGRPTLLVLDEAWMMLANERLRRQDRGVAAHPAQEECGRHSRDAEPQRNRQLALSRRHPGIVPDQALSAEPGGAAARTPARFIRHSDSPIDRSISSPTPRPSGITTTSRRSAAVSSNSPSDRRRWPSSVPARKMTS